MIKLTNKNFTKDNKTFGSVEVELHAFPIPFPNKIHSLPESFSRSLECMSYMRPTFFVLGVRTMEGEEKNLQNRWYHALYACTQRKETNNKTRHVVLSAILKSARFLISLETTSMSRKDELTRCHRSWWTSTSSPYATLVTRTTGQKHIYCQSKTWIVCKNMHLHTPMYCPPTW